MAGCKAPISLVVILLIIFGMGLLKRLSKPALANRTIDETMGFARVYGFFSGPRSSWAYSLSHGPNVCYQLGSGVGTDNPYHDRLSSSIGHWSTSIFLLSTKRYSQLSCLPHPRRLSWFNFLHLVFWCMGFDEFSITARTCTSVIEKLYKIRSDSRRLCNSVDYGFLAYRNKAVVISLPD